MGRGLTPLPLSNIPRFPFGRPWWGKAGYLPLCLLLFLLLFPSTIYLQYTPIQLVLVIKLWELLTNISLVKEYVAEVSGLSSKLSGSDTYTSTEFTWEPETNLHRDLGPTEQN